MQIKDFLDKVCNEIKYEPIRKEIGQELENHIEEAKEEFMKKGESEEMAIDKAIQEMGDAQDLGKQLNKIHKPKLDYKLLILLVILLCFTFLVACIKTSTHLFSIGETPFFVKTIIFLIIGFVLGTVIYFMDYTKIAKYSNYIYVLASVLVIYAVSFSNYQVNGIPHINIGNIFTISVNTVSMPLFLIAFIGFMQDFGKHKLEISIASIKTISIDKNLIKIIILSVFSLMLLMTIPSMTSAFVLGISYFIIANIYIAKKSKNKVLNMLKLWIVPCVFGIIVITICILEPYRLDRIMLSFYPELDPAGGGWTGINKEIIINSANLFGEADDMSNAIELFDEGTSEAFISILAHCGWVVASLLVITIILISVKLIINSIKVKDSYGKMLIIGISCLFILQSVFNVLMNLNLWIEASFELPFVSYGGTGLIINMMCLALVLSVYRRKDILINTQNTEDTEDTEEKKKVFSIKIT